jgi:hypothetical protein
MADQYLKGVNKLLRDITKSPVKTANGLQAKARLGLPIIKHNGEVGLDGEDQNFFETFVADVDKFLEPQVQTAGLTPAERSA